MLYRASYQDKINFLEKDEQSQEVKQNQKIDNKESESILQQKQKRAQEGFDYTSKGGIHASRCGMIEDHISNVKHVGIEGKRQIFSEEETINNTQDDTVNLQIKKQNEEIKIKKQNERQDRLDALAEGLRHIDNRKDSTISKMSNYEGSSNDEFSQTPKASFSIFDQNFHMEDKLPDKTEGEKIAENKESMKVKDDWKKTGGKVVKSSDFLDKWL